MISVQMASALITSGVVGGILGAMLVGFSVLKKKGLNVDKVLDTTENVLKTVEPVINLTSTLLPSNKAVNVLKSIEKWAVIAVGQAQQLYHAGSIEKDDRKKIAEDVVYKVLQELNIELTDSRKTLINAAIENAVGSLGHTEPTEVERQVKEQVLQAQVAQLTTENTNIKNAITTAASTVQTTIQTA